MYQNPPHRNPGHVAHLHPRMFCFAYDIRKNQRFFLTRPRRRPNTQELLTIPEERFRNIPCERNQISKTTTQF